MQVDAGPFERERKLLLVFFLRIAFFANLLGLGGFLAALVLAFLASLLGLVAAALGAGAQGSSEKREGAGNHREQFNALHIGPMICCVLQDITGFWTNTWRLGRLAAQFVPVIWVKMPEKWRFVNT